MSEYGAYIRLIAAIEHAKFLKIREHGKRRAAIPTIANRLKVIEGIINADVRLLCFYVEANVAKVWREKSVVSAFAHLASGHAAFDFYFLLVRIGLRFV